MSFVIVPQDNELDIVYFDIPEREVYEYNTEVTEHPVEQGANIVDHARDKPITMSLTGYVSQTPIQRDLVQGRGDVTIVDLNIPAYDYPIEPTPGSLFRVAFGAAGAIGDLIFGGPIAPRAQVLLFPEIFDRIQEVQVQLLQIRQRKTLVRVVTSTITYENMLMTGVSVPIEEPGGASFTIDLQQIRIITNELVAAPLPTEPRGSPEVKKGAQVPKPATGPEVAKKSLALKLTDFLGITQ